MIVEDKYTVVCPSCNKETVLHVGYSKRRVSTKDIINSEEYIGANCEIVQSGEICPYLECPFVKRWNLKHSPRD